MFSKPVFVTVGGFPPGESEYTEETIEIDAAGALVLLPDLVRCIAGGLVPEIEDSNHHFNGWQVQTVAIADEFAEPVDDYGGGDE